MWLTYFDLFDPLHNQMLLSKTRLGFDYVPLLLLYLQFHFRRFSND